MANRNAEVSQGDGGASVPPPQAQSQPQAALDQSCSANKVFKSGPLFLSSKGIGWTSWKKRWFILTQTSLVFFRSDPSAVPQRGSEANLTLGGIDLNNSGSVVVKADKKLLTVAFNDGRDGRTFTLKAETTEDLYEWKTALENALAQAPSATASHGMGQNGMFRNDQTNSNDYSADQLKDREPMKSTVIGRPILLALEEVDGSPSFLEKAMRFIEDYGVKTEGILRQAADVEDVERRVREYEQGKVEFAADEDAHVIGDCIKYVIRELPSSPIPASCCKALLEACRTDRANRVSAMRAAINDTFPEPNRHLLQRILMMMQTIASHKTVNRMSPSAVSACMAPLLLRPLLAGECEIENDFDVGDDGSVQLLQAAAAANHAQAIVITLLEEYDKIFGQEGSISPDLYTDSEESGSESEEATDDDEYYDDDEDEEEYDEEEYEEEDEEDTDDDEEGSDLEADDDIYSESCSESEDSEDEAVHNDKNHGHSSSGSDVSEDLKANKTLKSNSLQVSKPQHEDVKSREIPNPMKAAPAKEANKPAFTLGGASMDKSTVHNADCPTPIRKSITIAHGAHGSHRRNVWGRTAARKNLSMESIDLSLEEDDETQMLEDAMMEMRDRISEEVKGNAKQQADVEKQQKALHERQVALRQELSRLQHQLHEEKNSRAILDKQTKADLEELALVEADLTKLEQKVNDIGELLNQQRERRLKNKADTEVAATLKKDKSKNKDNGNERKMETPIPDKQDPQDNAKNSGSKGEERRSQTANEIQNVDKGRESGESAQNAHKQKGSETSKDVQVADKGESSDKLKKSDSRKGQSSDKLKKLDSRKDQSSDKLRKLDSRKGQSSDKLKKSDSRKGQSSDKLKKSDSRKAQSSDKLKKSDSRSAHHSDKQNQQQPLEKGKSEAYRSDKGR